MGPLPRVDTKGPNPCTPPAPPPRGRRRQRAPPGSRQPPGQGLGLGTRPHLPQPPRPRPRTHIGSSNLASQDLRASTFSMIMAALLLRRRLYTADTIAARPPALPGQLLARNPSPLLRPSPGTSHQRVNVTCWLPGGRGGRRGTEQPIKRPKLCNASQSRPREARPRGSLGKQQVRWTQHVRSWCNMVGGALKGTGAPLLFFLRIFFFFWTLLPAAGGSCSLSPTRMHGNVFS